MFGFKKKEIIKKTKTIWQIDWEKVKTTEDLKKIISVFIFEGGSCQVPYCEELKEYYKEPRVIEYMSTH